MRVGVTVVYEHLNDALRPNPICNLTLFTEIVIGDLVTAQCDIALEIFDRDLLLPACMRAVLDLSMLGNTLIGFLIS